jgi:hypothetical protein
MLVTDAPGSLEAPVYRDAVITSSAVDNHYHYDQYRPRT